MGKSDVKGYVVPNFRCKVTKWPFSKLSRNRRKPFQKWPLKWWILCQVSL